MPNETHRCVPPAGRSALRGLWVLLVLFGVVAMHAVGGGTHMATMITPASAGSRPAAAAIGGGPAGMPEMFSMRVNGSASSGNAGRPGSSAAAVASALPAADSEAMPLCLAVLAGLLALLLPAAARARRVAPGVTRVSRGRTSPPGRGPPRALLAQLCVLRT